MDAISTKLTQTKLTEPSHETPATTGTMTGREVQQHCPSLKPSEQLHALKQKDKGEPSAIIKTILKDLLEKDFKGAAKGIKKVLRLGQKEALTKALRNSDVDLDATLRGDTLLNIATRWKRSEVVQYLIELKVNVHISSNCWGSPLHTAALKGYKEIIPILIGAGANPNAKKEKLGNKPLHGAAYNGYTQSVKELIKAKADIHATNDEGDTPLHKAAWMGHTQVMQTLIDAGAKVDTQNHLGNTPLFGVIGSANLFQAMQVLLDAGADINVRNKQNDTLLHYAVRGNRHNLIQTLIKAGADHQVINNTGDGHTPLHEALVHKYNQPLNYKYNQSLKDLVSAGVNVNVVNKNKDTALHFAVGARNLQAMQILIKAGADINARNKEDDTPLHQAVRGQDIEAIMMLVRAGADTQAMNNKGNGHIALHEAVLLPDTEALVTLLQKGVNANIVNKSKDTALHLAVGARNLQAMQILIRAGANVNAANAIGITPLHKAAEDNGSTQALELLIKVGANLNAIDLMGSTPWGNAVFCDNPAAAEILKEKLEELKTFRRHLRSGQTG